MIRVGLTGGIAAGKSVAGARFAELGIPVVDYDELAREVVEPGTPGLAAIVEAFGPQVLQEDGELDRVGLGRVVFGDDDALDKLEQIIHPQVISKGGELDAAAEARGEKIIVHNIPLLVESVGPEAFDVVIVVDAPAKVRVARLVDSRLLTKEDAKARIKAQTDDDVRLAAADVVFDGAGSVENLRAQVDAWVDGVRRDGVSFRPNPERSKFLVTEDVED